MIQLRSLTQIADVSDEVENSQGFSQDNSTLEFPEIFTRHSAPPPANYFNNKEGIASRDDRRKNFVAPDSPGQQSQNTSFRSNRDVVEEIYEARILATEKEVEALHNNLSRERRINHELRAELERYVRSSDHAGAFGSGPTMKHAVKERVSAIAGPSRNNIGDKAEFPNVGLEGQDHDQKLSSTGDAGTIESVLAALANSRSVLAQTEQFMSDTAQEYAFTETDGTVIDFNFYYCFCFGFVPANLLLHLDYLYFT